MMAKKTVGSQPDDMVEKIAQLMQSENVDSIPVNKNEQAQKGVNFVTDRDSVLRIITKIRDQLLSPPGS